MTVIKEYEFDLRDDCWGGAKSRIKNMPDEYIDRLDSMMSSDTEALFGSETPTDTAVNDFIWFEDDIYAEWFGFDGADSMWKYFRMLETNDEDDIFYDGAEFATRDELEQLWEQYQREEPDWNDYYTDFDDYVSDNGWEVFEAE